MKRIIRTILLTLIVIVIASNAFAETGDIIKVQVTEFPPCVIVKDNGEITGFDIDIWNRIASENGWKTEFVVEPSHNMTLDHLKLGRVDVGIAGFTIDSDRSDNIDFSNHYFDSGLKILVLKEEMGMLDKAKVFWDAISTPAIGFLLFLVVFSHLIWWLEKDDDPTNDDNTVNDNYFPGILEAFYFCVVTCSTVGYGDYTPKKWQGRIVVVVLIVTGLTFFCNFTALLSSEYTVERTSAITSAEDLKGKVVITQTGTPAVKTLRRIGAIVKEVPTIDQACDWLLLERGDALVFDAPMIMEYAKKYPDKVSIVGDTFDKQYYGFALQYESNLRRDINRELLKLRESDEYQKIYNKWFKN